MKYRDYDIEHFITDEFFIQWVVNPNENNTHFWEKWLEQHPEKRLVVNDAANFIRSINYSIRPELPDKIYVDIYENILKSEQRNIIRQTENVSRGFFYLFPIRSIAATLLLIFCLWIQFESINYQRPVQQEMPLITMVKKSNPIGRKSVIELPDGSKIHLNSESELEFPSVFSDTLRWVSLKGEAFFEVKKEARPFYVASESNGIHVLGTTFNVNQSDNGSLYVALVTGKVRVESELGKQVELEPKEMLVLQKNGSFYKTGFDPMDILAWKDKILVFKSSDLVEVKSKLEKWYGIKVEYSGNFDKNWTYSGTYEDEILENVLKGICLTSGMEFTIEEDKVTINNPK
ncbi:FecR family protein [Cecembia rubra]|uniref:FecR family protein n=1 Tax=Cecembia rubra TaxID=1485585 RepID=A0A2P8E4F4_9BACT|nr:FecR family protein [Cecembia rubra]PSL04307.1 FecR family protein [Cecembia rubra]